MLLANQHLREIIYVFLMSKKHKIEFSSLCQLKFYTNKYYISSLLLDVQLFSYAIRKHWNVENKLHWQMDFTFESDDNTTMNKKALFDAMDEFEKLGY